MSHQNVNQTSGNVEIYTPGNLIELAKRVMGPIDLDPASSIVANRTVGAAKIYTKRGNGLAKPWFGNVWMNHPWGAKENKCKTHCDKTICKKRGHHLTQALPGNAAWIEKLITEYESGKVKQGMCITYASTSEKWFKPLTDYPICFLHGRTSFLTPEGDELNQNTKGCAITYFGEQYSKFDTVFSEVGAVMFPRKFLKVA
ncbi:MAG: DNA N-6-adenine-methyltransferase [Paraglaciecola polaris]|uniref:DNA N-6-adenine-methyltransferase n=1 Tax=Paraglaciecola polaris TaxID=222814 RepID=UPI00300129E4